jgi:hypothetical protein
MAFSPLLTKRRILAAAIESTPGTAVSLTSSNVIINALDASIDANIPYNERTSQGAFGRLASNVGAYSGGIKFRVEASGGGTAGTAPAYASVLFPACGMTASSGTFTPISAFASQSTVTIAIFEDGIQKTLKGAMGTWTYEVDDGKISYWNFDFKGVWTPVLTEALLTPEFLTAVIPPRAANMTLTVGSYVPTCSKLSINYGAQVEMRQDVTQPSGYISAVITDRKVTGSLDPETTTVANYDQFGAWLGGTAGALTATIGASGTGFTISAPVTQYVDIKEGNRSGITTSTLDFIACQSGSTPDSEISIAF